MSTDLTFITNEKGQNLKKRFETLIKDTNFFDALVGYFYTSGFHALYKSLEKTKKIRILIGISTNPGMFQVMQEAKQEQQSLQFSHSETKQQFSDAIVQEMEDSADNENIEDGVQKFIEWLRDGKLEIKAYPTERLHAKVYIMTFKEGDRDVGRVVTGSSNFTQAGLIDNLEFNVELKTKADYDFALKKFNELWDDAVDVSEKYVETIRTKTWLNNDISPQELYLKFLYEYFKDELNRTDEVFLKYIPEEFKKFEYQEQAVLNAKKILEEYGGVFISDVVGLGKTYIAAMLAGQLDGRTLVIAPPALLDDKSPGSWPNVFRDFNLPVTPRSIGELDKIIKEGTDHYTNVIVDEAHRFRTESNVTYEKLAEICRGKRVILVTATPYNNSPKDILSQIKLFQKTRKSTIPNLADLENFFNSLYKKIKDLDRQQDYAEYIKITKENAKEIREKVLKYLMVRRTRTEISKYFAEDLAKQNLRFPDVEPPKPLYYELDEKEDEVFIKTIEWIASKFTYARYKAMLYYKGEVDQPERLAQENMAKFMKILLIKRLESSFYAFRKSIERFIHSYEQFLSELDKGNVYVSKKYTNKIFEFLENDDDEAIQRLIDEGKAEKYPSKDFRPELKKDLEGDLLILKEINALWQSVNRDPKLSKFINELSSDPILKKNKLIIFTESKETAEYLTKNIEQKLSGQTICFTGGSSEDIREKIIENFDARARFKKDDYRILISTEVLSEGVNLHRSNVVINYDIPWNPTRMMQRVGRINRVDTKFDKIFTYNFFPTKQSNDRIKLREAAEAKINAFLTLLGGDAALLTEREPIGSHELFNRLTSKQVLTGEDEHEESELKYLQVIKNIRINNPALFESVKKLPKKGRTARDYEIKNNALLTYFRRGKLSKFYLAGDFNESQELDFLSAAKILEASDNIKKKPLAKINNFYPFLDKNKQAFLLATTEELPEIRSRAGRDSATNVSKILKAVMSDKRQLTDEQELYLQKVITQLQEGGLPKQTTKETLKALNTELKQNKIPNSQKILAILQLNIPAKLLEEHVGGTTIGNFGKREVILSEYLIAQ